MPLWENTSLQSVFKGAFRPHYTVRQWLIWNCAGNLVSIQLPCVNSA